VLRVKASGKIFISIASYRDELLEFTLKQAHTMAAKPNRLVFGVVEQEKQERSLDLDRLKFKEQIRYVRVDPEQSRGCCWARSVVQSLYAGEDFYLQIDSHTAFDYGWDELLVNHILKLLQYHKNPVITNYPSILEFDADGKAIKKHFDYQRNNMPVILAPPPSEPTFHDLSSGFIVGRSLWVDTVKPYVHGFLLSAGGLFSLGSIVEDVPYDPQLMFSGEEPSLALRLITNGYNILHIQKMPLFHLYTDHEKRTRALFWDETENENRTGFTHQTITHRSNERLQKIVIDELPGIYGLGSEFSLEDYKTLSGIDYKNRKYTPSDLWRIDYKTSIEQILKRQRGK
jgi:hypothetical protein